MLENVPENMFIVTWRAPRAGIPDGWEGYQSSARRQIT